MNSPAFAAGATEDSIRVGEQPALSGITDEAPGGLIDRPAMVLETGVYRGPHYYSHLPMVRIQLDLGRLEAWPSDRIPGFAERLVAQLPGLERHGCSYRTRGGFLRRLADGTWLGHVAEHVALELQTLAGHRATRGKTRSVKGQPGVYNIMYVYRDAQAGLAAGRFALELVNSLLPPELQGMDRLDRVHPLDGAYDFDARMVQLQRLVRERSFGPTTQALVDEARRRGIPVLRLDERSSLIQLGYGRNQQRIRASISGQTSLLGVDIAGDKNLTKKLLGEMGIPVPRGEVVRSADDAVRAAKRLRYPLVTKPLDGNHGRGVTTGIDNEEQLRFGFAEAQAQAKGRRSVIVEEFFSGRDHRILVIGGKLVAAAERVPARVIGDGTRSIAALIEDVNRDPRRGDGHEKVMTRIKVDALVTEFLARQGLSVDSVPERGRVVDLRATANLSTGGTAIDRTNEIHADNAEIARRAAAIVGLDICGIDFIAPDIGKSVRNTGGGIIEVNAAPGFRMHIEPSEGPPRDVGKPVIDMLFPRGDRGRIPIVAITGTNGKSTVGRMVKHILRYTGQSVGLTSTTGVYINDALVAEGDATGPRSARLVLRDPGVDVAVLETARGGLLREGLAFDEADVGIVLNVSEDHLGLKGINTLKDLANVKSLIVERVCRHGASILNADDPSTVDMARRARGKLIWFSMNGDDLPDHLQQHIDRGRAAVVREPGQDGGRLVLYREGRREDIMKAADIPATLHGMAGFNIANAMAAVAAALAQDVPLLTIRSALMTFQSTYEQNPGRLNVHDAHGFRVILDYAHNAAGLTALGELITGIRPRYKRAIGVLSIPGDRRDEDIIEMGRIAAGLFDELYFREDPATRGRPRGEIMALMAEGARERGFAEVHLIPGEEEATLAALTAARTGDLLVVTPSDIAGAWRMVTDFRPKELEEQLERPSA